MPLDKDVLLDEVKKFTVPSGDDYGSMPQTRVDARKRWANAFYVYLQDMECTTPSGVTDPSKTPEISGCEAAFFGTLQLPDSATPDSAAKDFADAWQSAMNAIVLVPGGFYEGEAQKIITTITPLTSFVSAQYPTLYSTLLGIFTSYQSGFPSNTHIEQITKIVDAFHVATFGSGGPTTCTYVNPAAPPPLLPGTLLYE